MTAMGTEIGIAGGFSLLAMFAGFGTMLYALALLLRKAEEAATRLMEMGVALFTVGVAGLLVTAVVATVLAVRQLGG